MKSANRQIHLHDLASEQLERTLNAGKPVKAEDRAPSAEELAARFALRPLSAQTQRRTLRTVSGSRRS
jgi:hypothetical protein